MTEDLGRPKNKEPKEGQRMINQPVPKRYFGLKEAAFYMGRGVYGVRELIWAGSLPCVRFGRRVHLDLLDLEKWIEQHKMKFDY